MNKYSLILLKFSAIFAVVGAGLGAHMAGAGSLAFRPIHAHILVVGWLSLFAFSVFYKIFAVKDGIMAKVHTYGSIIGSFGLTVGMWLQFMDPFNLPDLFSLLFYIIGGTILLIGFIAFLILTFTLKEEK